MKSRIQLSKRQRDTIKSTVEQELDKQKMDIVRRVFKAVCYALNEEYGFGKERCLKLIDRVSSVMDEHADDEIFWYHLDSAVIYRMGIDFEREDYESLEKQSNRPISGFYSI